MSLKDVAVGVEGSEGTVTLGFADAQELFEVADNLKLAKRKIRLNKDDKDGDGDYKKLGNGGIEISTKVLCDIVLGEADESAEDEEFDLDADTVTSGDKDLSEFDPDAAKRLRRSAITPPPPPPPSYSPKAPKQQKEPVEGKTSTLATSQESANEDEDDSKSSSSSGSGEDSIANLNASEAVEAVGRMRSPDKLADIVANDKRATVRAAAEKRLTELA